MDVYKLDYYKLNIFLCTAVGIWPYLDARSKRIRISVVNVVCVLVIFTQLLKTLTSKISLNLFIEILSNLLTCLCGIVAYVAVSIRKKQVYELLDQIREDWQKFEFQEECEVLKKYANKTRVYTVTVTWLWNGSVCGISLFMLLPILLDIIMPLDEPRPRDIPFPLELFFDIKKHYYISITLIFIGFHIIVIASLAAHTFFCAVLQHSAALFVVVGNIFESAIGSNENAFVNVTKEKEIYKKLVRGIRFHRRTVKFVENVNAIFEISYLIETVFGVIIICVDILRLLQTQWTYEYLQEIVICIFHITCNMTWIFVGCYFSQKILDTSSDLCARIFNTNWYSNSTKTQKLILMVIIRSMRPSYISIGKMFVSSLEFFLSIIPTSISYAMVCFSLRQ